MQEILLLKCGELVLKGLNRYRFEDRLLKTIKHRLSKAGQFNIYSSQSTIYVEPQGGELEQALELAKTVFGIVTIQRAAVCQKDITDICTAAEAYLAPLLEEVRTFRVTARRADKKFPLTSPQIAMEVGGHLHEKFSHLVPKMEGADINVQVEVREKHAYISGAKIQGAGGMPTGTSGRAMLLISGGIDSPVAGYMMGKRGLELSAVHFFSYPYTSEEAKQKVLSLAEILTGYCGKITVNVVPFTNIQEQIRDKCDEDYFTLVMRRLMMRISQRVAQHQGCEALITGESLAQVASQTLQAIAVTDNACTMPVFRPVIGMDKEEIVKLSRAIGAYETSILPFEDCCTVFTPKHPQTKPRLELVLEQEQRFDVDALVDEAFQNVERITLG